MPGAVVVFIFSDSRMNDEPFQYMWEMWMRRMCFPSFSCCLSPYDIWQLATDERKRWVAHECAFHGDPPTHSFVMRFSFLWNAFWMSDLDADAVNFIWQMHSWPLMGCIQEFRKFPRNWLKRMKRHSDAPHVRQHFTRNHRRFQWNVAAETTIFCSQFVALTFNRFSHYATVYECVKLWRYSIENVNAAAGQAQASKWHFILSFMFLLLQVQIIPICFSSNSFSFNLRRVTKVISDLFLNFLLIILSFYFDLHFVETK